MTHGVARSESSGELDRLLPCGLNTELDGESFPPLVFPPLMLSVCVWQGR